MYWRENEVNSCVWLQEVEPVGIGSSWDPHEVDPVGEVEALRRAGGVGDSHWLLGSSQFLIYQNL